MHNILSEIPDFRRELTEEQKQRFRRFRIRVEEIVATERPTGNERFSGDWSFARALREIPLTDSEFQLFYFHYVQYTAGVGGDFLGDHDMPPQIEELHISHSPDAA